MKITAGIATSSIPILTRFFWPPEIPRRAASPTRLDSKWSMPSTLDTWMMWTFLACCDAAFGKRSMAL
eukprot:570954-Prymnesium_polylepis.3